MFSGMSNHSVDAKGRIVLPAKFREELGDSFYIARGFGNACIQAMSREQFDAVSAKIMALPADKAMALQYTFAGIEGDALVIGMTNRIEIWSAQRFEQFIDSQKDTIAEALTLLRL